MDVPTETECHARALAERAWQAQESIGVHPAGFAAACLAVACRDHGVDITQLDLAAAADVSTATVRDHRDTIEAEREAWDR